MKGLKVKKLVNTFHTPIYIYFKNQINIHKIIINTLNINLNYLKTPCSSLTIQPNIKHHQFHFIILQIFKYRVLVIYTQTDCTRLTLLGFIGEEKAFGPQ